MNYEKVITLKQVQEYWITLKKKEPMPEFKEEINSETIEIVNKYIRSVAKNEFKNPYYKFKHGDGFWWLGRGYRNENLFFWHEDRGIIPPSYNYDDYGNVPTCFLVGNEPGMFAPNNWTDIIDHNNAIFISDSLIDEINTKLTKEKKHYSCLIDIHDNPYIVISKNEVVEKKAFNLCEYSDNIIYIGGYVCD